MSLKYKLELVDIYIPPDFVSAILPIIFTSLTDISSQFIM